MDTHYGPLRLSHGADARSMCGLYVYSNAGHALRQHGNVLLPARDQVLDCSANRARLACVTARQ
jgi:hypothetical protein